MNIIRLQGPDEKRMGIHYEYDAASHPLGEGGMGRVFKGFRVNERTGERMPVAIKAIYETMPEHVVERARREAEIQIDHDNLIRMYGFVENRLPGCDKTHYHVIMELLVGVTLEDVLKGVTTDNNGLEIEFAKEIHELTRKFKAEAAVRILKAILAGLMALHDRGIIHRDIDPSNIMLTMDNKIKLIDFGICKQIVNLQSQDKSLTSSGVFMGKVNYAAPELALGDVRSQNYTTDIYALGILLYQIITGHLPFSGTDQEILAANLHKPLPVREIKHPDIKKVIKKATDKSQAKRYRSAAEMRVDIERIDPSREGSMVNIINIGFAAGILISIGLAIAVMVPGNDEPADTAALTEETESPTTPGAAELLNYARHRMKVGTTDSPGETRALLLTLAADSAYLPAMLEHGMMYAQPTAAFPELASRQERMLIKPDLLESNKWLNKVLEQNPAEYKAAYWLYNNLMTKVEADNITDSEKTLLASAFKLFKKHIYTSDDVEAIKYRKAMETADDENTLKAWGILN